MKGIFGVVDLSKSSREISKSGLINIQKIMSLRSKEISRVETINSLHLNAYKLSRESLLIDKDNFLINFDGRIDNKDELPSFNKDISDASNILNLIKKNKFEEISKISGPFAFFVMDIKRNRVLAYRDHMGIRPFYFFYNKDYFIYGTEPNYIFESNYVSKEINNNKIKHYILKGNRNNNETFYKNINRLRRASYLECDHRNINFKKYYEFSDNKNIIYTNNDDYAEAFQELFKKIIKSQSACEDEIIGSMLSGGLDTSSITSCLFAEYKHSVTTKVKPYSITFKDLKKRDIPLAYETNYINDVCSKYNAQPNLIDLPYYDIQMELAEIQGMYPEPNYHGNKYMDLAIIDSMKKDGCQIIFSGFDGDSILTHGEQYLYELGSNYKFKRLLNETRARSLKRNQEYKPLSDIKKYFISPKIPNLIFHLKSLMGYQLPAKQTSRFLKKSISDELPINDMTRNYLNSRKNFKKFHLNTINTNTWEHIFEIQDIDYGRNGLEVRYPFMDRRLISFCLSLPNDQKLKNGISRYILRNAMKGIIPDSVYNRMSKSILSPYYDYSFENQFDFMKREVINSSNYLDKILDKDYIRKLNLGNINLNESIILQHIFILNKWLDFQ